jgi:hypothetical protein
LYDYPRSNGADGLLTHHARRVRVSGFEPDTAERLLLAFLSTTLAVIFLLGEPAYHG